MKNLMNIKINPKMLMCSSLAVVALATSSQGAKTVNFTNGNLEGRFTRSTGNNNITVFGYRLNYNDRSTSGAFNFGGRKGLRLLAQKVNNDQARGAQFLSKARYNGGFFRTVCRLGPGGNANTRKYAFGAIWLVHGLTNAQKARKPAGWLEIDFVEWAGSQNNGLGIHYTRNTGGQRRVFKPGQNGTTNNIPNGVNWRNNWRSYTCSWNKNTNLVTFNSNGVRTQIRGSRGWNFDAARTNIIPRGTKVHLTHRPFPPFKVPNSFYDRAANGTYMNALYIDLLTTPF